MPWLPPPTIPGNTPSPHRTDGAAAVEYVSGIPRSAAGKYEDFISRVGGER